MGLGAVVLQGCSVERVVEISMIMDHQGFIEGLIYFNNTGRRVRSWQCYIFVNLPAPMC